LVAKGGTFIEYCYITRNRMQNQKMKSLYPAAIRKEGILVAEMSLFMTTVHSPFVQNFLCVVRTEILVTSLVRAEFASWR
jgi:hypothetical protein